VIHLYPRARGWLVLSIWKPEPHIYGVLWDMLPYGGSLTSANDD